jgi:hypothetical protein
MRLIVGLVLTGFSVLAIPFGGPGSFFDIVYVALFVVGAALIVTSSRTGEKSRDSRQ